jgi:GH25 family lysozyme M1 (1,4-beta-N-acetylmuramidase)
LILIVVCATIAPLIKKGRVMAINFRVVDVYHGDSVTSFQQAADAGLWAIIHKATTGATGHDSAYAARRPAALAAGLLWGAYHWGTAANVDDQITNFIHIAQPDANTLVALDFEATPGNQMTLEMAKEFLMKIEQRLGRKAVLYGGGLLKTSLGHTIDPFLGSHRLWLAHYNKNPICPATWNEYWLWQYTDNKNDLDLQPSSIPGIPGNLAGDLDCDSYDKTRQQLKNEWAS